MPRRRESRSSGRCFPDRRNRGVCFEEVRIESGADGLGKDPGAWAPLLIRDLPVFAWWPDSLNGSDDSWQAPILDASSLIDKLIVDSGSAPDHERAVFATARSLLALKEKAGGAFFTSDFAWRRSRVLRELTARAFDQPETRPGSPPSGQSPLTAAPTRMVCSSSAGFPPGSAGQPPLPSARTRIDMAKTSALSMPRRGFRCRKGSGCASVSMKGRESRSAAPEAAASPMGPSAARTSSPPTVRSSSTKWTPLPATRSTRKCWSARAGLTAEA